MKLIDVRCGCGKLLGRIDGSYELKCQRCKVVSRGNVGVKPVIKDKE